MSAAPRTEAEFAQTDDVRVRTPPQPLLFQGRGGGRRPDGARRSTTFDATLFEAFGLPHTL